MKKINYNIYIFLSIILIGDIMLFYLIGIKGSGMSALAKVLYEQGHIVKGVDSENYYYTQKDLKHIKIESFKHMNLKESYFYIIGNAYQTHSVTKYIQDMDFMSMTYPKFLSFYFKNYNFISVSGSHGKTTTTKILTTIVKDCSFVIGDGTGSGKDRETFVLESCEYKNTFLNYKPDITLILNVDYDHPDFFKDEEEYTKSFAAFANQSKIVIANGDDKNINKIKDAHFITYGVKQDNDVLFSFEIKNKKTIINILERTFILPFAGKHYAYDFMGAYLVAKFIGKTDDEIEEKLKRLELPKRRLETKRIKDILCIHDYAHHPTEIKSVYESVRQMYPNKQICCIFQPHTISRSVALEEQFKTALSLFDIVYIMKIFTSVRENVNLLKEKSIFEFWNFPVLKKEEILNLKIEPDIVYLFLGAGDIDETFNLFVKNKKGINL